MLALLAMLAAALLVGRFARRIGPRMELLLLGAIAAIVVGEFLSWETTQGGSLTLELLHAVVPGW